MNFQPLPVPSFFNAGSVGAVWRVPYQERSMDARKWAVQYRIASASKDAFRVCLLLVDVQNTFCIPEFELYVGGADGMGAVNDNRRLCEFIYRNLSAITEISLTMDTHQAAQIFHSIFFINNRGEHPDPLTLISLKDLEDGVWRFNPDLAESLKIREQYGQQYVRHYAKTLKEGGKYDLTIWPYHAMLGGIGHALVSAVEEAVFFHGIARYSRPDFKAKGDNPLTENYSILSPEVTIGPDNEVIAQKKDSFIKKLLGFDAIIIAGQAKSHCVAWTVEDLLSEISKTDVSLAGKVYLLEDCMSPVVIPGVLDYTEQADNAFQRFADAGMHIVQSIKPISSWPGMNV